MTNFPQFVDFYIDDNLIGTRLIVLEFDPAGVIVNAEAIQFEVQSRHRGTPSMELLGHRISTNVSNLKVRLGDTITIQPGLLRLSIEAMGKASP